MGNSVYKNTNSKFFHGIAYLWFSILSVLAYPLATAHAEPTDRHIANHAKTPVLVIRFNQKNVYFEKALRTVVDSVSDTKVYAYYEVESVTPNSAEGDDDHANAAASANLRVVVAKLRELGVPSDRIGVREAKSDSVTSQEISVFVQK